MMRDWAAILRRLMPLLDFCAILIAFRLGYLLRYEVQFIRPVGETNFAPFESYTLLAGIYALWIIITPPVITLYRRVRGRAWLEEVYAFAQGVTTATVIIMAINFLIQPLVFSRLMILEITVLAIAFLSILRLVERYVAGEMRRRHIGVENVIIIGAGATGRAAMGTLLANKTHGYRIIGFLDDDPERLSALGSIPNLGALETLPRLLRQSRAADGPRRRVDLVLITLPWRAQDKILEIVAACEKRKVQVRVVPDLFRLNLSKVQVEQIAGMPIMGVRAEPGLSNTKRFLKRMMDVILVLCILPLLALPMGLVALFIRLDSPGPIFFKHRRVGVNGVEFDMLKFRSMYEDAEARREVLIQQSGIDSRHFKMKDDPRVTQVGRWIRRLSVDEWPNFLNVLRGEMSLIGPRAPTPKEVDEYEPWQRQRLNTLPGVSGLWQVSGRSNVSFEEMCLLDIYYIENWSIMLDLQIMLRTIPQVLFAKGAY